MSGLLGKNEQGSNQIALNLSSMTFMVAMGFSVVAMIRHGEMLGKNDIINLLIEFLKNKELILENRNFDLSFNMTDEGINVKCKINTDNDLKKNKLQIYSPSLFSYLKIDFLEDLKIKYYESRKIIIDQFQNFKKGILAKKKKKKLLKNANFKK